jgi:hypothetical protein
LRLLDAAFRYARQGWLVFRLAAGTKKPMKGTRGFKDATTDRRPIRRWWRTTPDANVGIATGRVSDLLVLDIDPRNGGDKSIRKLEESHGSLPKTVSVRTAGGGRHYYFSLKGKTVRSATGVCDLTGPLDHLRRHVYADHMARIPDLPGG